MSSKRDRTSRHARRAGEKTQGARHAHVVDAEASAVALASALSVILGEPGTEEERAVALIAQLKSTPRDRWSQVVLDLMTAQLRGEELALALSALFAAPLESDIHEQAIRLLERGREQPDLELLVHLGDHGQSRAVRREAQGALLRLQQAGVVVPGPQRTPSPRQDARSWPVERAWANRVDCIGSQAVGIARRRPQGDAGFVSVVVSDDRGVVDGMGELGISLRAIDRRVHMLALPTGAPLYAVSPEYVCYRVRQGLATGVRAHRPEAPDFRRWSFLLEGIDDAWEPDLEGLCREHARPAWLERTAVLMLAVEYVDWWPDPDARDGGAVRRFLADVTAALARLPDRGRSNNPVPKAPPYIELLAETEYIAVFWPFDHAGSAAIETLIDRHIETVLPPPQLQRFRDALLQMGYLAELSGRPTLCTLVMTAAWALGANSGVTPRQHPFLRQALRRAVEVAIAL